MLRKGDEDYLFSLTQKSSLGEPENADIQLSLEFSLAMGKIAYLSDFFP
ncbi:MAG: hypothetical protein IM473_10695 [Microcystis sp. M015S2]|nr:MULTISPECIES: hypothetical protein [unclassified Microcystis]MCA2653082.1 hypothetical protein [Microcystis sp. M061S2]MCA2708695.1 hypothetical protein [Microcystis sp. M025S2]MCA2742858.1 hypothetical protein [Microcystis sp. M015S2]MCA2757627.1 hypothetical protein [Microcystis sp. M145S2]